MSYKLFVVVSRTCDPCNIICTLDLSLLTRMTKVSYLVLKLKYYKVIIAFIFMLDVAEDNL